MPDMKRKALISTRAATNAVECYYYTLIICIPFIYPRVVYTTDRSRAVVPMLFLFCVAL